MQLRRKTNAKAIQEQVSQIFHSQLAPILEQLFSDFFPEGKIVKIDRLVINLGKIKEADLSSKLAAPFRQQLSLVLSNIVNQPLAGVRKISTNTSDVELLAFYLKNGYYPWWVQQASDFDVDQLIQAIVQKKPKFLKNIFEQSNQLPAIQQRLKYQLSETTWQVIAPLTEGRKKASKVDIAVVFLQSGLVDSDATMEDIESTILALIEQESTSWMKQLKRLVNAPTVLQRMEQQLSTNTLEAIQAMLYGESAFQQLQTIRSKILAFDKILNLPTAFLQDLAAIFQSTVLYYLPCFLKEQKLSERFLSFFYTYLQKNNFLLKEQLTTVQVQQLKIGLEELITSNGQSSWKVVKDKMAATITPPSDYLENTLTAASQDSERIEAGKSVSLPDENTTKQARPLEACLMNGKIVWQQEKEQGLVLASIIAYLTTGVFTRENPLTSPKQTEEVLLQYLTQQPKILWNAFTKLPYSEQFFDRLEDNFTKATLDKMLQVFESIAAVNLTPILRIWEQIAWQKLVINQPIRPISAQKSRRLALAVFLFSRSKLSKPIAYFKELMEAVAEQAGKQLTPFLELVASPLKEQVKSQQFHKLMAALAPLPIDQSPIEVISTLELALTKDLTEERHTNQQTDQIAFLEAYVTTGQIAWWAQPKSEKSIAPTIANLAESNPQLLKELLQKAWSNPISQKRLLKIVPPKDWLLIVKILHGQYVLLVEAIARLIEEATKAKNFGQGKESTAAIFKWLHLLAYIWSTSSFSSETFVVRTLEKVLKTTSTKLEIGQSIFLAISTEKATTGQLIFLNVQTILKKWINTPNELDLQEEVQSWKSKTAKDQALLPSLEQPLVIKNNASAQLLEALQNIRFFLEYGALRTKNIFLSKADFLSDFQQKLKRYPTLVRRILVHLTKDQEAILRILSIFPNKMLLQIIRLLYLGKMERIASYWQDLMSILPGILKRFDRSAMDSFFHYHALVYYPKAPTSWSITEPFLVYIVSALAKKENTQALALLHKIQERIATDTQSLKSDWGSTLPKLYHLMQDQLQEGQQKIKWRIEATEKELAGTSLYINNAGLVLIAPFYARYFDRLGMTENGQFLDEATVIRAVHLLQYIATGQAATAEPLLVFNKILCGLPMTIPIPKGIEVTEEEKTLTQQMLMAILAHWKSLGTATIEGLRGGFLIRDGKLVWNQDGYWNLEVEKKAFDVLMQGLPWSISIVQFSWMEHRIQINWL